MCCAACSLDEGGLAANVEGGAGEAAAPDVAAADVRLDTLDEPAPPLPCTSDSGACTAALSAGWTPTAFEANRTATCPANFTSADVVAAPLAQKGACRCSCTIATPPSCAVGTLTAKYANNNQCGISAPVYTLATEGQCTDCGFGTFTVDVYNSFIKIGLTPGTCTTAAVADKTKIDVTAMRTCAPPTGCSEDVCNGVVPAGMRACIAGAGDVACPAGPFSDKVAVIGDDTTLACGACSACSVTQSPCGNATVKYWGDANCTVAKGSAVADGNCNTTGSPSQVNHLTYENPVTNVACNAGGSAAAVDVSAKRTVCCRP